MKVLQIIETDGKTTLIEWKTIDFRSKLGNTSQIKKRYVGGPMKRLN
jgi:hypothetical protein